MHVPSSDFARALVGAHRFRLFPSALTLANSLFLGALTD